MSEGSNEPGQVWGKMVASDRSPPLSPALAVPPGQFDGQGTVRPHQFSNSVMSPQNALDRYATQDPRREPSDPTGVSHVAVLLTSLEEVAAQRSMMAADQLSREELRAIRHAIVETHGRLPAQVPKNLAGTDNGDTNLADGRRVSCSVDSSPHHNLVFGKRGDDSSYGQPVPTPIRMMSSGDSVSAAESGDEESGGATLACHKVSDLIYGRDVQTALTQHDTQRVSLGTTHSSPDSTTFAASESPAQWLPTPSSYDYMQPSQQPTINSQPSALSYKAGVNYQQHNRGQPSDITEGGYFQHGLSQIIMQESDVGDVTVHDPINSGHSSVDGQDGDASSSVLTFANISFSTIGQYDQLEGQHPPGSSHLVDNHGNSMFAIASNQGSQPAIFNAVAATGTPNDVDLMDEHLELLPESTVLPVEDSDSITTDTGADSEMVDPSLTSAQDHDSINPSMLQQPQQTTPISSQWLPGGFAFQTNLDGTDVDSLDSMIDDFERNLDVSALLEHWTISYGMKESEFPPVGERALRVKEWKRPDEVRTKDLNGDFCDPQGVNWVKLGTTRENARTVRNKLYVNYTNIKHACPSEVSVRYQILTLQLANPWL